MTVTRRTRKEVLEEGLGRLQKLLAALPAQQRLDALGFCSETLRSSLLRHMELQHRTGRSVHASSASLRSATAKRKAPELTSPRKSSTSKGISMIKTKDGHRRYFARAIISGIAISSRCVRSVEEAQDLRAHLEEVRRHRAPDGRWLELFDNSQDQPGHTLWHFRATVDARRFLGRTLSSRQVTCIRQALALKKDLDLARQQGWPVLRASWVQSMQEPRGGRFGHRALSPEEADAMCRAAEEKAGSCPRVHRHLRPQISKTRVAATLRAQRGQLVRQKQLQRLVLRLERTLKAIQLSRRYASS